MVIQLYPSWNTDFHVSFCLARSLAFLVTTILSYSPIKTMIILLEFNIISLFRLYWNDRIARGRQILHKIHWNLTPQFSQGLKHNDWYRIAWLAMLSSSGTSEKTDMLTCFPSITLIPEMFKLQANNTIIRIVHADLTWRFIKFRVSSSSLPPRHLEYTNNDHLLPTEVLSYPFRKFPLHIAISVGLMMA